MSGNFPALILIQPALYKEGDLSFSKVCVVSDDRLPVKVSGFHARFYY